MRMSMVRKHISFCTSTIESAVYENRKYDTVRGRELITSLCLITI